MFAMIVLSINSLVLIDDFYFPFPFRLASLCVTSMYCLSSLLFFLILLFWLNNVMWCVWLMPWGFIDSFTCGCCFRVVKIWCESSKYTFCLQRLRIIWHPTCIDGSKGGNKSKAIHPLTMNKSPCHENSSMKNHQSASSNHIQKTQQQQQQKTMRLIMWKHM